MSKALDLVKGLLAPEPRPIVSDGDDLTKAGKYRSRKRAMVGGKMRWVYDYGDEKEQGESSKDSHVGTTTSGKKIPASHKGKTFSEAHAGYSGEDHYEAADAHDDAYDKAKAKGDSHKAFHHKIMGQAHFQAYANKGRKDPAGATGDSIAAISHEHGGPGSARLKAMAQHGPLGNETTVRNMLSEMKKDPKGLERPAGAEAQRVLQAILRGGSKESAINAGADALNQAYRARGETPVSAADAKASATRTYGVLKDMAERYAKKSESDAPTLVKSEKSFTFGSCTYVERDPYTLPEGGGVRRPGLDPVQRAQPPVIDDGRDPYVGELRRLSGQLVRPDHGILHRLKHGLDGSDEG